jgi:ribosomal protein L11 methyltransferase
MIKFLWALSVHMPLSAVDRIMAQLPEGTVSESAFIKDVNDRSADPIWTVQGLYKTKPDYAELAISCEILAQSNGQKAYPYMLEEVPTGGWLTKNQASYAPIKIGNFVIHGVNDRAMVQPHQTGIEMEASCAFGTGEHPTTFGCLMALQLLKSIKAKTKILDIGTGSGVLAIAIAKMKKAKVLAGEMDKPSVDVAVQNIKRNGVARHVRVLQATGFCARVMQKNKPYDVIVSNIFARPLARLAPAMRRHIKMGGHVILAGFLRHDVNRVRQAYARQRIFLKKSLRFGHWSILILKKS